MRFAIDCGHGQDNTKTGVFDPGACGSGLREHDLTLELGKKVEVALVTLGHEVLLLDSGRYWARDNIAEKWGANYYLSLHFDGSTNQGASGTSVYVNRGSARVHKEAAKRLGSAVAQTQNISWRGVFEKNFGTLGGLHPDMLLEVCFITNPKDILGYQDRSGSVCDVIVSFLLDWAGEPDKEVSMILQKGNKGDAVEHIQKMLLECGFTLPKYGADGDFGDETEATVKSFQKSHFLVVDGIVGRLTMASLRADYDEAIAPTTPDTSESDALRATVVKLQDKLDRIKAII